MQIGLDSGVSTQMNWKSLLAEIRKDMKEYPAIAQYHKELLMKHLSLSNKRDLQVLAELRKISPPNIEEQVKFDANEEIKLLEVEIERLKK